MQPKTCPKLAAGGSWAKRVVLAQGRQLARVVGIAPERRPPAAFHELDLSSKPLRLLAADLSPSGGGFVVAKLGEGRPEVQVAGAQDLEAEIDVVKGDCQLLIKPADLLVDRAPHHEAGGGDGRDVARRDPPADIARRASWQALVGVAGEAAEAEHDPGVLHGAVRVEEPRADATDLRAKRMPDHLGEPIRRQYLDVVVDEGDHASACLRDGEVVDGREIEWAGVRQNPDPPVHRDRGEIAQGLRLARSVVDDDHLEGCVGGLLQDGVEAAPQEREPVAGWHDDRNQRRRGGYGVADAQNRPAGDRLDLPGPADAAKML